MFSIFRTMWLVGKHLFSKKDTIQYPEQKPRLPARWRGRIILSCDPNGKERCVACHLCSAVCPVDCIALQATEDENGRRYPAFFRINFSRCIFCGLCEEACRNYNQDIYRFRLKEDLLISGTGKYPDYNFYRIAGIATEVKDKGQGENEKKPVSLHEIMP